MALCQEGQLISPVKIAMLLGSVTATPNMAPTAHKRPPWAPTNTHAESKRLLLLEENSARCESISPLFWSQVASLGYPSTHRSPKRRPHAHYDTQRAMPRPDRVAITPDIRGESVPV